MALKFKKRMNMKFVNIVDPCYTKNNLGKSISQSHFFRIKEAFKDQSRRMRKMTRIAKTKLSKGKDVEEFLVVQYCKIFRYTLEITGKMPTVNLHIPQIVAKPLSDAEDSREQVKMKGRNLFGDKSESLFDDLGGDISDDQRQFPIEAETEEIKQSNYDADEDDAGLLSNLSRNFLSLPNSTTASKLALLEEEK